MARIAEKRLPVRKSSRPADRPIFALDQRAEDIGVGFVQRAGLAFVDQVGGVLIFDIMGGNFRLITRPVYDGQRIYVKALLTHGEYDRKEWMKWA